MSLASTVLLGAGSGVFYGTAASHAGTFNDYSDEYETLTTQLEQNPSDSTLINNEAVTQGDYAATLAKWEII